MEPLEKRRVLREVLWLATVTAVYVSAALVYVVIRAAYRQCKRMSYADCSGEAVLRVASFAALATSMAAILLRRFRKVYGRARCLGTAAVGGIFLLLPIWIGDKIGGAAGAIIVYLAICACLPFLFKFRQVWDDFMDQLKEHPDDLPGKVAAAIHLLATIMVPGYNGGQGNSQHSCILEDVQCQYINFAAAQCQLRELRYNSHMMEFLRDQMDTARKLRGSGDLSTEASQKLEAALKQGDTLIEKHSMPFDISRFYKIEEAANGVCLVCERLRECFDRERLQIACEVPRECIDRDREHLYAHLGYVLKGKQCSFGTKEGLKKEWESIRVQHEGQLSALNVLADGDIAMGRWIGEGGYSQVYEARWGGINVAVKKMKTGCAGPDLTAEEFAELFKEVSTHASLNHPRVVRLFGITTSGWMVMELADGNLSSLRSNKTLTWPTMLDILRQAADGLEYMHCRQPPLMHGDVKDTNYLYTRTVDGKYEVKLADFGLTKQAWDCTTATVRGVGGTALWKAPELHDGKVPTIQSDVFSFGLIMHAAVTGLPPYGSGTSEFAVMRMKLKGEAPCVVGEGDCPEAMRALMARCVATDPMERPTMTEVKACLSKLPEDWQLAQRQMPHG